MEIRVWLGFRCISVLLGNIFQGVDTGQCSRLALLEASALCLSLISLFFLEGLGEVVFVL